MANEIFANHAHVFPADVNPGGTIDRLLQMLDACEIAGAVCFAPFGYQVEGRDVEPNDWLAKELKGASRRSRLHGFGTLELGRRDVAQQVRRIADLGLKGIKMHPNAQRFDILSDTAFDAYRAAEELDLFITFHSGVHHYRLKEYNVLSFDEVAQQFPKLRFSMEHVGGYHFFAEALAVIFNNIPFPPEPGRRCMVFGGLTSVFTQHYNRFWYMSRERMDELIAQVGAQQCIFGLDFPYNLEENTKLAIQTLRSLELKPDELSLILGGNLRRELRLPGAPPLPAGVSR